jgi:GNAT superfamily N-acetyltransferase
VIVKVDRNYLEINSIKELKNSKKPNQNCLLRLINPPDFQINKFFYKQVGKKYRWIDRLTWNEQTWISYVKDPKVKTYILKDNENLVGYFEQILHFEKKDCELAYFGILEDYYGKKYGGFLLTEAIKNSFINGIERVWVHTCSLDHKYALKNYQARGMRIFKTETINLNSN